MDSSTFFKVMLAALLFITPGCDESVPATVAPSYNPFPECAYEHKDALPGHTLNVGVPMRDCKRLSTNLIFPNEVKERYPAILIRTPYDKGKTEEYPLIDTSLLFRNLGFVTINQDTRGRFDSEGLHVVITDEPADTVDTLAWLEMQPWFDGRLGVWGLSYLALSSIIAAVERPDLVDAVVVGIMGSDWYQLASHHGVARADGLRFAAGTATSDSLDNAFQSDSAFAEELLKFPLAEADARSELGPLPFTDVFIDHLNLDQFWTDLSDPLEFQATDLPVYMVTGWFDFQWRNQVGDYNALYKRRGGQDHFLHIGPWPHPLGLTDDHDYRFDDPRTGIEAIIESVLFMQYYVLGEGDISQIPPVRYFDAGTGLWHDTDALWASKTEELVFYPASSTDAGCPHRLLEAPATAETVTYTYDPEEPFEMPGVLTLQEAGMLEEVEWCGRTDGHVFETAAFSEDVELTGDMFLDLEISSDVEDTPFVGRLDLVDGKGTVWNLREGVMLLSHREGDHQAIDYSPGEQVTLSIPIPPLRWTIQKGQRLRVGVASSAWPLIVPHPNVAGDWVNAKTPIVAHQTLHLGSGTGSRLRLTVASD